MLVQREGYTVVHGAAAVRLGMQDQGRRRIRRLGRHVAALKTTFRSVDDHLGHWRVRLLVILWKGLIS